MSTAEKIGDLNEQAAAQLPEDIIQRKMAVLRVRCIARYGLAAVPGRPEELVSSDKIRPQVALAGKTISLAYASKSLRIRKHGGPTNRQWLETLDLPVDRDGWLDKVQEFLDPFFGYQPTHTDTRA